MIYDRKLEGDTSIFFKSPMDPFMTPSQLPIIETIDPILLSAVRGHIEYNNPTARVSSTEYSGNRGQKVQSGHTAWEAFMYQNLMALVGGGRLLCWDKCGQNHGNTRGRRLLLRHPFQSLSSVSLKEYNLRPEVSLPRTGSVGQLRSSASAVREARGSDGPEDRRHHSVNLL